MKILNLYAGIGGNRKLWEGHEVTAVEHDASIAKIYKDFFPNDTIIVGDAHQYLLDHYKEFDFIWSSPPCPSHSDIRRASAVSNRGQHEPIYPDMKLYEEILFLQGYCKAKWVVENVMSWYDPLIKPYKIQRHYFWTNFHLTDIKLPSDNIYKGNSTMWQKQLGFDLSKYKDIDKRKILRNCTTPELGLHILNESQSKTTLF